MKTIEVTVRPDGSVVVHTRGFAGRRCRDASGFLEQALGSKRREVLTAEYYQARQQRVSEQSAGQG